MRQERNGVDCLCSAAILICIVFGLFECIFFIAGIEDINRNIREILSVFILFSILCSFLYYSKKSARISIPIMVIFLSFIAGIFRKQLMKVCQVIAWNVVFSINRYYGMGWEIKENMIKTYSKDFQDGMIVFFLLMIFLLSIDVAGFIYAKRIFLLFCLVLIFGMLIGRIPSGFYVFLMLFGLFGLFSMSSKSRDFQKKWKFSRKTVVEISCREREEEREAVVHGGQKAAVITIGCFFASLLLSILFQKQFGEALLAFHMPIQNWANELEYNVLNYDYNQLFREVSVGSGSRNSSQNGGARGRLSNFKIQYSGKEVLQITVDTVPKKGMYLRGFIGKDYKGDHWSTVDEGDFLRASASWEMDAEESMEQRVGELVYSMLRKKEKFESYTSKLKINYIDAPGQYAYLPYFTKIEPSLEIAGDGIINRKDQRGEDAGSMILDTKGFWRHSGNYYRKLPAALASEGDIKEWEKDQNLERQYAAYVEEQYLTVPNTTPTLRKVCEEFSNTNTNASGEKIENKEAARFIRKYLKQQAGYSMDLKRVPYRQDFVEYFLYTQNKGYCIHFATAAVLMYRMLGIPARFVEGYVVWPEDFVENKDGTYTASIPDSRAHAWAEVYYPGFGFMPVDMTPGDYEDFMESGEIENLDEEAFTEDKEKPEDDQEKKEETLDDKKEEEADENNQEDLDKEQQDKKENQEKNEGKGADIDPTGKDSGGQDLDRKGTSIAIGCFFHYVGVAVLMAASIALLLLLFLLLRIFYYRRKYKSQQKALLEGVEDKRRREIIKISCRFYECLKHSGIEQKWKRACGRNISDREYEKLVKHEFIFLENNEYHKFREIVQKALYCPPQAENVVSEKEVGECREFVRLVKSYLLERLPFYKKVLVKGVVG